MDATERQDFVRSIVKSPVVQLKLLLCYKCRTAQGVKSIKQI